MAKGNRPKYWLKITDKKNTKDRAQAGVAFENEFGQLNIKLNPGIVLHWNDEVFITLNPYSDDYPPPGSKLPVVKRKEGEDGEGGDDGDITF
jgi:hypothetical protein